MNIDTSTLQYAVRNDLVIVGYNPEMADMPNPNGELEGLAHYIIGVAPDGRQFIHSATAYTRNGYALNGNPSDCTPDFCWDIDSQGMTVDRLERLAAHLNEAHPSLDANHWSEGEPTYGSVAYQRSGAEARARGREVTDAYLAGEISYEDAHRYHGSRLS